MLKARLNVLRTIAFSALLLIGCSAFAAKPVNAAKSAPVIIDFFAPLQMPRYEQWRKLSPKAREEFIEDVQAFLLRADAMARSGHTEKSSREAQLIQRLFDIWIQTAEAKTKSKAQSKSHAQQQPYCINQGVVKPLSECDTKLGYGMHNFDTNEKLGPLGEASHCQAPEKPCSPFFGFTAQGQMFCSSLNLTRDCKQKSEQEGTISLATTLAACEKGSPGTPKVDCGKLKNFFNEQMSAVDQLCKDAPKRFACGILKDQIQVVMGKKDGNLPAASPASASETDSNTAADAEEGAVPDLANYVKDAAKMENGKTPCPPEQTVQASAEPKAVAQTNSKTNCVSERYELGTQPPVFGDLYKKVVRGLQKGFVCSQINLPDKSKLTADREKNALFAQETPNSPPVLIDGLDLRVLDVTSAFLLQGPYNINKKDLLPYYFPKQSIVYPDKISELPTRGWISTNGSRFRYALDDQNSRVLLSVRLTGATKELLVEISPEGAKVLDDKSAKPIKSANVEEPAKAQEPSKASEDTTSRAASIQPE